MTRSVIRMAGATIYRKKAQTHNEGKARSLSSELVKIKTKGNLRCAVNTKYTEAKGKGKIAKRAISLWFSAITWHEALTVSDGEPPTPLTTDVF